MDRGHRWKATGQRGATIWFTGLPASGKSPVAVAVERALVEAGDIAYLLDGDNIRHGLSDDLGFSPGDRAENNRRVGHLTRLFADARCTSRHRSRNARSATPRVCTPGRKPVS